jgi:cobalt-precorrin 5A hydrolase
MAGDEAVSAAVGVGCRAGASAEAVERLVREALARAGLETASLHGLRRVPALTEAAARLGLALYWHDEAALRAAAPRIVSHSPRVAALFGVGSVAEAAALAGAGADARIVIAKFSADGVSVAVAKGGP